MNTSVEAVLEMAQRRASARITLQEALSDLNLLVYETALKKEGFDYLDDFQCNTDTFKQEIMPLLADVASTKPQKIKLLDLSQNAEKYCKKQRSIVINQMPALNMFFFHMYERLEDCGKQLLDNTKKS